MEESEDSGSTWPQRAYPCMFCQRGFTSAQALGGHMNVHRRDRALLRQRSSQNHHASNLPGARVAEDQTASACYAPISGDRQSRLIPISRACTQSRPSRARHVKEVPLIQLFPCAVEGHGAWHTFQDPMDPERQINKGGAEESKVDLELRLGLKPPD